MAAILPFFNSQVTIQQGFAMNKEQVQTFFQNVRSNPQNYGVPAVLHADALTATTEIISLSRQASPFTTLAQGVKLTYGTQGNISLKMFSVFSIMGWVFTVANSPPPATATVDNFYFPLSALYAKFCRIFSTTAVTGSVKSQPQVIAVAMFNDNGGRKHVMFGSTLDSPPRGTPSPQPSFKDTLQEDQRLAMVSVTLLAMNEYHHPRNFIVNPPPVNTEQKYGHCAETWFFWVVKANVLPLLTSSAAGFAVRLSGLFQTNLTTYSAAELKQSLVPPCPNCGYIIQRLSLNPNNFKVDQWRGILYELEADNYEGLTVDDSGVPIA